MIGITAVVTFLGVLAVLMVRPARAVGILIMSMYVYPEYLRIPMGLAQMSAPRLVALFLLARLLCSARRREFRWRTADKLVIFGWAWSVAANILTGADHGFVTELIGRVFDTVLMYFTTRLAMLKVSDYAMLLGPLAICAVVLSFFGVMETITFHSPYQGLSAYSTALPDWFNKDLEFRYGMLRAAGSTAHPIYFGMAMFLLLGILYGLRGYTRSKLFWGFSCLAATIALLSSLSSGPQQALAVFLLCSIFYRVPMLIKPAVIFLVVFATFLEMASNRHFWYLTEYLNFFGGDYWYRSRLMEVAITQWRDYGLIGMGSKFPSHWGMMIDGRQHVDIVNQYVIVAVTAGLVGLANYVAIQLLALRDVVRAWPIADRAARPLLFSQGCVMIALMVSSLSVGLFGVVLLMSFILYGMMIRNDFPVLTTSKVDAATVRSLKPSDKFSPRPVCRAAHS